MITVRTLQGKSDNSNTTKKESEGPLPNLMNDGASTSTLARIKFPMRRGDRSQRRPTKNEQLLESNNFHLLRACEHQRRVEEEKRLAIEKHRRRQTLRVLAFSDLEDFSPSPSDKSNPESSPLLPSIREQARKNHEAKKYVRFVDDGAVELISPSSKGVVRIENCKVPVSSSDIRLDELRHIDQTIKDLKELPDFGYEEGNFVTEDEHVARNWRLMTQYVFN